MLKIFISALLIPLFFVAQAFAIPKNLIILIGDGMGFEHVKAAGMYLNGQPGTLSFESFPYQGQLTTYSADNTVTDSAAAGTALATGQKVNNNVVSVATPGAGTKLVTILEYYKSKSKSTGIVTSSYLSDATPAAFGSHAADRDLKLDLANFYFNKTKPNVLFGGGGNSVSTTTAANVGYTILMDSASLASYDTVTSTLTLGYFGTDFLPYEYDGVFGDLPHLNQMAAAAISQLSNDPDGFFLLIEGGMIDKASHNGYLERTVWETIEFSSTTNMVYQWAQNNPDTLIIVTADHETGSLSVTQNNGQGFYPTTNWIPPNYILHSAADVPLYAWGSGAEQFFGVMNNTDIFGLITNPVKRLPLYAAVSSSRTFTSSWGSLTANASAGTLAQDTTVLISTASVTHYDNNTFIPTSLGFEISMATPTQALQKTIAMKLQYDSSVIPSLNESLLFVGRYDSTSQAYVALASTVNVSDNTIEFEADKFARYAMLQRVIEKSFVVDSTAASTTTVITTKSTLQISVPASAFTQNVTMTVGESSVAASGSEAMLATGIGFSVSVTGGLQPQNAITVLLTYNESDLTDYNETELVAGRYDDTTGRYVLIPSTVNTLANTITFALDHLSSFAILQPVYQKTLLVTPANASRAAITASWGELLMNIPASTFSRNVSLTVKGAVPPISESGSIAVTDAGFEINVAEGLQPRQGITLKVSYNDSAIAGHSEANLVIGRYDETRGAWLPLSSSVDASANTVTCVTDHLSRFALLALKAPAKLEDVYVFPNPFTPSQHAAGLTFANIPANAEIKIYNLSGELVSELREDNSDGRLSWAGINSAGEQVASGLYIAILDNGTERKTIKIAVLR